MDPKFGNPRYDLEARKLVEDDVPGSTIEEILKLLQSNEDRAELISLLEKERSKKK